jgi:hypothetical protein
MGWSYRKSFKVGALRFTLSKSGVTTSVGGKGVRMTSSSRGTYITAGAKGISYRARVGGGGGLASTHGAEREIPDDARLPYRAPSGGTLDAHTVFWVLFGVVMLFWIVGVIG